MVVSWLKLDSTAKKTYPRVTTDKQIENEKCGTITHTKSSLNPFILNKNSSGKIHSVLAFQTSLRVEGMSEIQAKRFSLDSFSPFCVIN